MKGRMMELVIEETHVALATRSNVIEFTPIKEKPTENIEEDDWSDVFAEWEFD